MTLAVSVVLGKTATGERHALFSPDGGITALIKRVLGPYGLRQGAGYLVPLHAALSACGALQKRGAALRAKKDVPLVIRESAWKCEAQGLFPYQRLGAEYLRSRRRGILADQMGLGKTVSALAAIDAKKGTLVVAPSVVRENWLKETIRWRKDLRPRLWEPPYPFFPEPGEVNIVSYPRLPYEDLERRSRCPWCDQLSVVPLDDEELLQLAGRQAPWTDKCDPARGGKCCGQDGVPRARKFKAETGGWPEWVWIGPEPKHPVQFVVDEAHYCKNRDAQRTIGTRTIAAACASGPAGRASTVWLLTGTPLLNQPPELWSLCQLFPGPTGKFDDGAWDTFGSWSAFVDMFDGKKQIVGGISRGYEWGGRVKPEARECLGSVMLRRMRADVLPDLPKKTRRHIEVPISKRALSKDAMLTENLLLLFKEWSDDQVLAECAAGGALSKLRKELADLKVPILLKLIKEYEEVDEPLVVFSYHRDPITSLGERKGWGCITGSTADGERAQLVEKFQKGLLKGLAGTIGAMGVGVTLTRAANMIFLDRDFVPANNLQAEDRELRIGQERGVVITILDANHPIDERVSIILEKKEMLLEAVDLAEEKNLNLDRGPAQAELPLLRGT